MMISEQARYLPKWGYRPPKDNNSGLGWIEWKMPPEYEKFAGFLISCPKLHERIGQRFQDLIDKVLVIDWIEFRFNEKGIVIDVPGDRCGIYPESGLSGSYGGHNIDTYAQTISLFLCFVTALEEIYHLMTTWEKEEEPKIAIEVACSNNYRVEKSLSSKQFKLWEAYDNTSDNVIFVVARTWEEAENFAEEIMSNSHITPKIMNEPMLLSGLKVFEIEVIIASDQLSSIVYRVLTGDAESARQTVEFELKKKPLLFDVKSISIINSKGELPEPVIIDFCP